MSPSDQSSERRYRPHRGQVLERHDQAVPWATLRRQGCKKESTTPIKIPILNKNKHILSFVIQVKDGLRELKNSYALTFILVNAMWIAAIFMLQNNQVFLLGSTYLKKPPYLGRTEHQMAPWTNLQQHHIWKPNDTRTGCVKFLMFCPVLNFLFVGLKPGLRQSGIPPDGTARILFPDNLHWNHGHPGVLPLNKKGNHSVKDTAMQKYGDWWSGGVVEGLVANMQCSRINVRI